MKDNGIIEMRADHKDIVNRIIAMLETDYEVFCEELGNTGLIDIYYKEK